MKITHPKTGHNGITEVGPFSIKFVDGVAEVEDLNDGAKAYLKRRGYGIGSSKAHPIEVEQAESPDPRKVGDERIGTPTRDAAVDPRPDDFLAPTNAGKANPHGPDVVSPGIHANQGVRPVKPGDVHVDETDAQDDAETEHAEDATDGIPVTDGPTAPAGNAGRDAWAAYVTALGEDPGDRGRDELRDTYGPKA